jgi:hypothetical protein
MGIHCAYEFIVLDYEFMYVYYEFHETMDSYTL